jgi:colicin import membrane protein
LSHNFLKEDKDKHELSALFEEWLVFKSSKLELDRTRMSYAFEVKCEDGRAIVTISHIRYVYDEARKAKRYVAENWITDKEALNKKGTRLTPLSRKFRRKTVDRKDFLFNKIESLLK